VDATGPNLGLLKADHQDHRSLPDHLETGKLGRGRSLPRSDRARVTARWPLLICAPQTRGARGEEHGQHFSSRLPGRFQRWCHIGHDQAPDRLIIWTLPDRARPPAISDTKTMARDTGGSNRPVPEGWMLRSMSIARKTQRVRRGQRKGRLPQFKRSIPKKTGW